MPAQVHRNAAIAAGWSPCIRIDRFVEGAGPSACSLCRSAHRHVAFHFLGAPLKALLVHRARWKDRQAWGALPLTGPGHALGDPRYPANGRMMVIRDGQIQPLYNCSVVPLMS